MRFLPFLVGIIFPLSQAVAGDTSKIEICHIPPDDPENAHVLMINERALRAHFEHGDFEGSCIDNDGCPSEMARVGEFCIDRWEANLVSQSPYEVPTDGTAESKAFTVPQGYISGQVAEITDDTVGIRIENDAGGPETHHIPKRHITQQTLEYLDDKPMPLPQYLPAGKTELAPLDVGNTIEIPSEDVKGEITRYNERYVYLATEDGSSARIPRTMFQKPWRVLNI